MTDNDNIVPVIMVCTRYNQISILHEFRGLMSKTDSSLDEQGQLVGNTQVFARWRFILIPRMGGFEKLISFEERSEIIDVELDTFWSSLATGAFDPLTLERDYPQLTFKHLADDHPAVLRAEALDLEVNSPDYQWQWLCEQEFGFSDVEPKHFVFTETNIRQIIKRMTSVPMFGGFDQRTTTTSTLNDQDI